LADRRAVGSNWAVFADGVRGVERVDDRRVISGIVHVLKSGCRWCDCPPEYGPPTTIYNRFVRWARRGLWERIATRYDKLARNYLASVCLAAWWI